MRGTTIGRNGWAGLVAGAALAWSGVAAPALGSQGDCRERPAVRTAGGGLAAARGAIVERDGGWEETAVSLVRLAEGRAVCDPGRREALSEAARYYGYAGAYDRAAETAFRAAELGRLTGHLTESADAFIAAATFALEADRPDCAARAARQASMIAESPLLTTAQRMAIRRRAGSVLTAG